MHMHTAAMPSRCFDIPPCFEFLYYKRASRPAEYLIDALSLPIEIAVLLYRWPTRRDAVKLPSR